MTTTRPMIPLDQQFQRRLPEIGRLKLGVTTDRAMKAITEWRFVTTDLYASSLDALAALYGGTPRPYSHPKSSLTRELLSDAPVVDVRLPILGETEPASLCAEEWGGGGLIRRCEGTEAPDACMRWVNGAEGPEQTWGPCECFAAGEMSCDPKFRVSFFLKGDPNFGVWRLETSSSEGISEMRGLIDMIQEVQAQGILEVKLGIDPRSKVRAGKKRKYVVPVIINPHSMEALASGEARMKGSLGSGARAEIGAGTASPSSNAGEGGPALPASTGVTASPEGPPPSPPDPDAEVIEAEVVEDPPEGFPPGWADTPSTRKGPITKAARVLAEQHGLDIPASFDEIDADLAVATLSEMGSG